MLKKSHSRWAALVLAAGVICVAVATAASAAVTPKAQTSGDAVITGELRFVSHTASRVTFEALIHNFKIAYPNVTVNAQYLPTGPQFAQALLSMVNSGNAPDVLFTNPNKGSDVPAQDLGRAGRLLDLSGRPFVKRIPVKDRGVFVVNRKVYAAPIMKVSSGINYNVSEMQRRGWAVPTTFAQLLNLCGRARSAGIHLIAFPGQVTAEAINAVASATVYNVDPNWDQKRARGSVRFATSGLWQRVYAKLNAMKDRECFQPGWQAAGVPDMAPLMAGRRTVMQMAPSQGLSTLMSIRPDDTWGAMAFPGNTAAQTRVMIGYNLSLSVSSSTKNRAAALAFIDFAGREGQSRLLARLNGSISLVDANNNRFPQTMARIAPLVRAGKWVGRPQWATPTTVTNINSVTSAILAGGRAPRDAMQLLDDTWGK